jgi:hypothetical protein
LFAEAFSFEILMFRISIIGERINADTSAGHEITGYLQVFGIHQPNQILHNDIHAVFMEIPMVTEGKEVEFETFALHHLLARDIRDINMSEIRLSCFGAKRGELRAIEFYEIIIARVLVRKPFKQ